MRIKSIKYFLILLLGSLPGLALQAQTAPIVLKSVTRTQGLSQSFVMGIAQDPDGFIWLGTSDGLNRFDGHTCIVFRHEKNNLNSLHNNWVNRLACDTNGILIIGFQDGTIQSFNPASSNFQRLDILPGGKDANNFTSQILGIQVGHNNTVWVTDKKGQVLSLNPDRTKWKEHLDLPFEVEIDLEVPDPYLNIALDEQGTPWVYSRAYGLFKIEKDSAKLIRKPFQILHGDEAIEDTLAEDNGTRMEENIRYAGKNRLLISHAAEVPVYSHTQFSIYDIEKDKIIPIIENVGVVEPSWVSKAGILWIPKGTHLIRVDIETLEMTKIACFHKGIQDHTFTWLFMEDESGLIWGRNAHGIVYFNPQTPFNHYTDQNKTPFKISNKSVRSIHQDPEIDSRFWISGYDFVDYFEKGKGQIDLSGNPSNESFMFKIPHAMLRINRDTLLIGLEGGSLEYVDLNEKKSHTMTIPRASDDSVFAYSNVFTFLKDRKDNTWFGASRGAFILDLESAVAEYNIYHTAEDEWNNQVIHLIEAENGIIWGGTQKGILRIDHENKSSYEFELIPDESVATKSIALRNQNELWVGTNGYGLMKVDLSTPNNPGTAPKITQLTTDDGLPSNVVYGVLTDENQDIWMSTNNGLAKYEVETNQFFVFSEDFGIQESEFNTCAYEKARDGELWFGGLNGITTFYPNEVNTEIIPFPPILTNFTQEGIKEVEFKDLVHQNTFEIPPFVKVFSFEFTTADYFHPEKIVFAYRIIELDENWIEFGAGRQITFRNLPSGTYTFEVRATDRYGRWQDQLWTSTLEINPHWYSSLWFKGLIVLFLLGFGFTINIIRLKVTRRQNILLEQKVKERTEELRETNDEIGLRLLERESMLKEIHHRVKNNLEVISSLLNLQSIQDDNPKVKAALQESRSRVFSMALLHQNLYQSGNFAEVEWKEYLERLLNDIQAGYGRKDLKIDQDISTDNFQPGIEKAVPLGLIVNELITNAFKHAFKNRDKGKISIQFKILPGDKVQLTLKDNGVGIPDDFDPEGNDSLGLLLVNELCVQLNGRVHFKNDNGTTILLTFKR